MVDLNDDNGYRKKRVAEFLSMPRSELHLVAHEWMRHHKATGNIETAAIIQALLIILNEAVLLNDDKGLT